MSKNLKTASFFIVSLLLFMATQQANAQGKGQICQVKIVTDSISLSGGTSIARPDAMAGEGVSNVYQLSNFSINGIKQKGVNEKVVKQLGFRKGYSFTATQAGLLLIAQKVCEVSGYRLKMLTMTLDQNTTNAAMLSFDFER